MAKNIFTVQKDDLGYSLISKKNCTVGPCRNLSTLEEAASRAFAGQPEKQVMAKNAIKEYKEKKDK